MNSQFFSVKIKQIIKNGIILSTADWIQEVISARYEKQNSLCGTKIIFTAVFFISLHQYHQF